MIFRKGAGIDDGYFVARTELFLAYLFQIGKRGRGPRRLARDVQAEFVVDRC
jgi:hypothetical protein